MVLQRGSRRAARAGLQSRDSRRTINSQANKTPRVLLGGFVLRPLAMTYSCMDETTLPSAQVRFTSEFKALESIS